MDPHVPRSWKQNWLSRRAECQNSEVVESLTPKQINSEFWNYILCAPVSMILQMNYSPFALIRVTYLFLCVILILLKIVNGSQSHEHISLAES